MVTVATLHLHSHVRIYQPFNKPLHAHTHVNLNSPLLDARVGREGVDEELGRLRNPVAEDHGGGHLLATRLACSPHDGYD